MRTGCLLTVCQSLLPGGGGALPGGYTCPEGVPAWGVYLPRGVYLPGGGVPAWGVYLPGHTPPPVNRITHTCKNITLAQLRCGR